MGKRPHPSSSAGASGSGGNKRFKGGNGGRDGGEGSRKKNFFTSGSGRFIGPGIFLTTVRNKEAKATDELLAVLNDLADELYPGIELSNELPVHAVRRAQPGDETANEGAGEAEGTTGEVAESTEAAPVAAPAKSAEQPPAKAVPAEDDVEAQIAAELAELKGQSLKGGKKAGGAPKPRNRFETVDVGTECLRYIQVTAPMDPFVLVRAYLEQVERTGEPRSRFVQRVTPMAGTCYAHIDDIKEFAELILPRWFAKNDEADEQKSEGTASSSKPRKDLTFRVEPRIRLSTTLTRDIVIPVLAAAVPEGAGHRAQLSSPDLTIFFESHRGIAAMGVLEDYERFKKYNPQQIAEVVKKARQADQPSRVAEAQAGEAKAPVAASAEANVEPAAASEEAKVEVVVESSEVTEA